MSEEISDAIRHLETDMVDIMPALVDDITSEIILNPYKKPGGHGNAGGGYIGHILVERKSMGLDNLFTYTEAEIKSCQVQIGDVIIYKQYSDSQEMSTVFWVKLANKNIIDDLKQIAFCIKSDFNTSRDKIIQASAAESSGSTAQSYGYGMLFCYAEMLENGYLTDTLHVSMLDGIKDDNLVLTQEVLSNLLKQINHQLQTITTFSLKTLTISNEHELTNFTTYPAQIVKANLVKMSATRAETIMSVLASITGKFIHNKMPHLECQIPKYGHRFTGVIPPVVNFPSFCIRKHLKQIFSLDDLIKQGVMTVTSRDTIVSWLKRRFNILIAGGTGSGKTTLANAILREIAQLFPDTRMLIIEDVPELRFNTTRSVALSIGEFFSLYDALRTTLRFSPQRIIMGEVRGAEAYTLLKAWNTGHPGGIATIHANGVDEALYRFESCVRDHPDVTINRQEIGFTINGIIAIQNITERQEDSEGYRNVVKRKVTALRQILQYDVDKDIYQDIKFHNV